MCKAPQMFLALMHAPPRTPRDRLFGDPVFPTVFTVKVMEFMSTQSVFPIRLSICTRKPRIPEAHGSSRIITGSRNDASHRIFLSVLQSHFLMKIQKPSALRKRRHTGQELISNLLSHGSILCQLPRPQFRIAAAQQQTVQPLRQGPVPDRYYPCLRSSA